MSQFHNILKIWYQQNKRDLPWRNNNDPYLVWISEIILQQTRVEQGISCYYRLIDQFPNVKALADASEKDVLLVWQGLGYYSRARNMHFAARQIMEDYKGIFPHSYEGIKGLKGIGNYTAAAIASISFGLPYAVIDGNVYRVLSRIFGITTPIDTNAGKKEFAQTADSLLDKNNPGAYNEAIMDFGAIHCKPKNPLCSGCPFQNSCEAFKNGQINLLPVKSRKPVQRYRYLNYLFIKYLDSFYLHERSGNDIWKNMFQLPLIEQNGDLSEKELISSKDFQLIFKDIKPVIESVSPKIIHNLTHQKLQIRYFSVLIEKPLIKNEYFLILPESISSFPLPKPINSFLEKEIQKRV